MPSRSAADCVAEAVRTPAASGPGGPFRPGDRRLQPALPPRQLGRRLRLAHPSSGATRCGGFGEREAGRAGRRDRRRGPSAAPPRRRRDRRAARPVPRLQHLGVDHREGRDVGVPLEQRRDAAGRPVGQPVELPDRVDRPGRRACRCRWVPQLVWPARWNCTMRSCGTAATYSTGSKSWLTLET